MQARGSCRPVAAPPEFRPHRYAVANEPAEIANVNFAAFPTRQIDMLWEQGLRMALSVVLALVVLVLGLWVINRLTRLVRRVALMRTTDTTVALFLGSAAGVVLKTLLFVSVASMLGLATTSFVAVIGAAGLAIGLALQGSLANVAGGLLILVFKPLRVGEYVEAQGVTGTVVNIEIFHTIIRTIDHKLVVIPNGILSNGIITNFTREPQRGIDWIIGIDYADDLLRAKEVLAAIAKAEPRVLADPAPVVVVEALADNAVQLMLRAFVNRDDYFAVRRAVLEQVKLTFDAQGLSFPHPQRVVRGQGSAVGTAAPPAAREA